jgi:biopolymer transport protein ExbB
MDFTVHCHRTYAWFYRYSYRDDSGFRLYRKGWDISPTVVAGGMKVALLTTVFGLITAIILQLFYNYLVAKIESLVNAMEDTSISFMDIVVKYKNDKNI